MVAWPVDVPSIPLVGTLSVAERENLLRGPSDIPGTESRRSRFSGMAADYTFSLIMTTAELADLRAFFKTDCKGGALSFTANDYSLSPVSTATFVWGSAPTAQAMAVPGYWTVAVALVRVP
jgi:hypothetical protein